jgi:hypothetical protein
MTTPTYPLYKVRTHLAMQDPLMPGTRYHVALFLQTSSSGSGHLFNVVGDLVTGMSYASHLQPDPKLDENFYDRQLLGRVSADVGVEGIDEVLRVLPPPPKQREFNTKTMRMEQVDAKGRFFEEGESRPDFVKCTEWTERVALPELVRRGLLREGLGGDQDDG